MVHVDSQSPSDFVDGAHLGSHFNVSNRQSLDFQRAKAGVPCIRESEARWDGTKANSFKASWITLGPLQPAFVLS